MEYNMNQTTYKTKLGEKQAPTLYSVDDLIRDYERTSSGHYFDTGTMSFFKSRVVDYFRGEKNKAYFITSERFDSSTPRLYTIRIVTRKRASCFHGYKYSIETLGEFQAFKTSLQAKKQIEKIMKGE